MVIPCVNVKIYKNKTCIKEIESGLFNGNIPSSDPSYKDNDPGRLIRTASKAFREVLEVMKRVVAKEVLKHT